MLHDKDGQKINKGDYVSTKMGYGRVTEAIDETYGNVKCICYHTPDSQTIDFSAIDDEVRVVIRPTVPGEYADKIDLHYNL